MPVQSATALDGQSRQFSTVRRIGSVPAETEESIEARTLQVDVGGRLQRAGHEPQQPADVDQTREQDLDAWHHAISGGLVHFLRETFEVRAEEPTHLPALWDRAQGRRRTSAGPHRDLSCPLP